MELEPLVEEGAVAHGASSYSETLPTASVASRCRTSRARFLRIFIVGALVVCVVAVMTIRNNRKAFEDLQDRYANSARADVNNAIGLSQLPANALSRGCVAGQVCICDSSATVGGCFPWNFSVGDVLVFEYGPANGPTSVLENTAMQTLYQGAVHASIVTEVNGPLKPDLSNIIVTEALKGTTMMVKSAPMGDILKGRVYHSLWINRVDRTRFPNFDNHAAAIGQWGRDHIGNPFDQSLMWEKAIPFPWRWVAPNWIECNPDCNGRAKALNLFRAGGPQKWFCSQFVAWTLAFPGGLNTDYGAPGACVTPPWEGHVEYLQMAPGDLINQPFYDPNGIHVPCASGCVTDIP